MGRELRLARRTAGMRQQDVARVIGTSKSRVCRVEHGQIATLSLEDLSRHAAAVGLKPYLKLFRSAAACSTSRSWTCWLASAPGCTHRGRGRLRCRSRAKATFDPVTA